ncbi:SDR family NAD(P)-dependent oxidoreductase [Actinomadura sp. HBU206391]|uniref:SDR family NAD(P)-dependent oxidoreductase n=1 Tax=Actinomadura sp. HBU206391 TaxID=2731692 RepID=UPI00165094D2|nr:SDR family oxidoreductase [Actinomadura sp. HBU206391]MBC6460975.1 SDR family oxidoreductase [Actinomadura sp. HBU206391]
MDLSGRSYLVAGGAGVVGECVTQALLGRGATVAVPSRSPERLDRLRSFAETPRLHTVVGDVGDAAGVEEVRDRVTAAIGPLDGVIASLGAWWEGTPLTDVSLELWQRILHDNLTSHFLVARTFLPLLTRRPDGVYVALSGIAALRPIPLSGPISVTDAAQTMLMRTFAAELAELGEPGGDRRSGPGELGRPGGNGGLARPPRIHEVAILTPVVTRRWLEEEPIEPGWLSGEQAGSYIADVAGPGFPAEPFQLRLPADWDIWA